MSDQNIWFFNLDPFFKLILNIEQVVFCFAGEDSVSTLKTRLREKGLLSTGRF